MKYNVLYMKYINKYRYSGQMQVVKCYLISNDMMMTGSNVISIIHNVKRPVTNYINHFTYTVYVYITYILHIFIYLYSLYIYITYISYKFYNKNAC